MSLVAIKNLVASAVSSSPKFGNNNNSSSSSNNNNNNTTTNNNLISENSPLINSDGIVQNQQSESSQDLESGFNSYTDSQLLTPNNFIGSPISTVNDDENFDHFNHNTSFPLNLIHNIDPRVMSDLIIGLSDGLTVPFALTAGLSSLGDSKLVITGGMAELVSGAISMGLGGYLAAKSESEFYYTQVRKEKQLFFKNQDSINDELYDILIDMGASELTADSFVNDLSKSPNSMIDFIIRFGKGLEEPPEGRILSSAITIGSGYFFGGFIPLIPYFFLPIVQQGLLVSVILMLITLFWFGYFKSLVSMGDDCSTSTRLMEGLQMVLIGSIAAGSAWSLVYLIDN